ncbi:MAG TPA: hypothetical protein VHE58_08380 [Burkholderiales bacterium]|nr:hypothetical protein [Burkholderiales bacterium]
MNKTALTVALGAAFAASLAVVPAAKSAGNPFAMDSLKNGYQVAGDDKKADGKCGEGKYGATKGMSKADREANAKMMQEGKCGEGKCGAKNLKEGKCGEGKCGASKK